MSIIKTILNPVGRAISATQSHIGNQVQNVSLDMAARFEDPVIAHNQRTQVMIAQNGKNGAWASGVAAKKLDQAHLPHGGKY